MAKKKTTTRAGQGKLAGTKGGAKVASVPKQTPEERLKTIQELAETVDRRKKVVDSHAANLKVAKNSLQDALDDLHLACKPEPDLPMFDKQDTGAGKKKTTTKKKTTRKKSSKKL